MPYSDQNPATLLIPQRLGGGKTGGLTGGIPRTGKGHAPQQQEGDALAEEEAEAGDRHRMHLDQLGDGDVEGDGERGQEGDQHQA